MCQETSQHQLILGADDFKMTHESGLITSIFSFHDDEYYFHYCDVLLLSQWNYISDGNIR